VATWQPSEPFPDDIPEYLYEAVGVGPSSLAHRHELWHGAQRIAAALAGTEDDVGEATSAPSAARLSGRFLRLVTVPGVRLDTVLEAWWAEGVKDDSVLIGRRLRLESPRGDAARGWVMVGRIRRFTRWHSVPVVVELWPVYEKWTMMTMTPRVRVFASQRYFRTGQAALDRLTAALLSAIPGIPQIQDVHPASLVPTDGRPE
jgi:hypothetical protein